ncbi:unnamed protein product, partial [marine sediment metagenome]
GDIYYDESFDVTIDSLDNVYIVGSCCCSFGAGSRDMVLLKYIQDIFKSIINFNRI